MSLFDLFKLRKHEREQIDDKKPLDVKQSLDDVQKQPFIRELPGYKEKGINMFDIRGMEYRNLASSSNESFIGFVKIEENNIHDPYAIAVYKNPRKHIGYIPKGSKQLFDSLKNNHNGTTFAWGNMDYGDNWNRSYVNVIIGLSEAELNLVKEIVTIQNRIYKISGTDVHKALSTDEHFNILESVCKAYENISTLSYLNHDFHFYFPVRFLQSFSKELEQNKDYGNLIKLEKYLFLNDGTNNEPIINRINKAKKNT